tara:strand:- start:761 stop:1783 length:1023 start_codon:yes stop_codon:yes gene_type:complete
VPQESSKKIYIEKAFFNARRCLKEARERLHPSAEHVIQLTNPKTGIKEDIMDIEHAIKWCVSFHVKEWSQSTWRLVRSSYSYMLNGFEKREIISTEKKEELIELMQSTKGLSKKQIGPRKNTSARRKKSVSLADIRKIESHFETHTYKWGESTINWLWASIGTGLRPKEWKGAKLEERDDGRLVLVCRNSKHNEVRSFGACREIDLTDMPENIIRCVRVQEKIFNGLSEKDVEEFYWGCVNLLTRVNEILFPRRESNINLYTGRHQFSSNAKANPNVSSEERAALMGHKSTRTSSERYGRTKSGNNGLTPQVGDPKVLAKIVSVDAKQPSFGKIKPSNNS